MSVHVIGKMPRLLALAALFVSSLTVMVASAAQAGSPVNTGYFGNVAIKGYDPVAYFTEGRPVKGSEQFAYDWLGATWQFASAEHRETFAADPDPVRAAIRGLLREQHGRQRGLQHRP